MKWDDLRRQKFSEDEIKAIDKEAEQVVQQLGPQRCPNCSSVVLLPSSEHVCRSKTT